MGPRPSHTSYSSHQQTIDRRVDSAVAAARQKHSISIGVHCNAIELLRRPPRPQHHARRPDRPDQRALTRSSATAPSSTPTSSAKPPALKDPKAYIALSLASMARHVRAMLSLQSRGSITFDYGNNIRQRAKDNGVPNAFDFPGFVPAFIRPQFCLGRGPFRWVA